MTEKNRPADKKIRISLRTIIPILILVSIISILLCAGIGPVSVSPAATLRILLSRIPVIGEGFEGSFTQMDENVIREKYPLFASSLFNLLQNAETAIGTLKK